MKILKSRKALSPVVASIILIAVTVAVSLAVAVWMGSLTTGQMVQEKISFVSYQWASPGTSTVPWVVVKIKNIGDSAASIQEIRVDDVAVSYHNVTLPYSLDKGSTLAINLTKTGGFSRGVTYRFSVLTSRGNVFGPYSLPAP
ncbi:MAG: archaellin/type IV pilin N-terminal domain-containing protein [Candidatus Bathyarchaeia archaeon]